MVQQPGGGLKVAPVHEAARSLVAVGLSAFPVKVDGSKAPVFNGWRVYATRQPTPAELRRWFDRPDPFGIGVPGGAASGNLIVLDFEGKGRDPFAAWAKKLTHADRLYLDRCPLVRTPSGGAHVYVRTPDPLPGAKYARDAAGKCLVEARGSQHYVVAPGSPAKCHASGRPYLIDRPGWLGGGPAEPVPVEVFFDWLVYAADLNEYVRPARHQVVGDRPAGTPAGDRPGDHFNARVGWEDILTRHGWKPFRSAGHVTYWTRPGKREGVSASTGFCRGEGGSDLFYCFSTSAAPFEAEVSYSRFAVYALLEHRGDFRAATRALGQAGYGQPLPTRTRSRR